MLNTTMFSRRTIAYNRAAGKNCSHTLVTAVNPLFGRLFAAWTSVTCILCVACAWQPTNRALYCEYELSLKAFRGSDFIRKVLGIDYLEWLILKLKMLKCENWTLHIVTSNQAKLLLLSMPDQTLASLFCLCSQRSLCAPLLSPSSSSYLNALSTRLWGLGLQLHHWW